MKKLILASAILFSIHATAQVGIGVAVPAASAQLEVKSTNKGFLPPRISLLDVNDVVTVASPVDGLVIYNTATAGSSPNNVVPGFYVFAGSVWVALKKDDLGNHTAVQNLKMNNNWISNDGDNQGIYTKADGNVGIGTSSPAYLLDVNGTMKLATAPTITNATNVLTKNPSTNQLSEHEVTTKASGTVNEGVPVTLDNIQVRLTTTGNRSIEMRVVTGTIIVSGNSVNMFAVSPVFAAGGAATISGYMRQSATLNTTYVRWQISADFPMHGSLQTITIRDETNDKSYRITLIVGLGYLNNSITIERIA